MSKIQSSFDSTEHTAHLARMRAYYATTAQAYNHWHADLSAPGGHNFAVAELLKLMQTRSYGTLLDVCCGTGRAVKACLENGIDAFGIDASQDLINQGVQAWGLPPDRFTCADATKLPFADNQFDVTSILGALHHCAVPDQIVAEATRVSRHAIVISDEGNHLTGGIRQILKKLGLFNIVYRIIFRRPVRTMRRAVYSDQDGPAYVFSVEEILPFVHQNFRTVRTFQFYRIGHRELRSSKFPRLFARNVVIVADSRR